MRFLRFSIVLLLLCGCARETQKQFSEAPGKINAASDRVSLASTNANELVTEIRTNTLPRVDVFIETAIATLQQLQRTGREMELTAIAARRTADAGRRGLPWIWAVAGAVLLAVLLAVALLLRRLLTVTIRSVDRVVSPSSRKFLREHQREMSPLAQRVIRWLVDRERRSKA